jgi:dolichol-phosphate mannosyltransferase
MICAYVFPAYNESQTLPYTITSLLSQIYATDYIIIADDSAPGESQMIQKFLSELDFKNIVYLPGEQKGGRGAAVWRSFLWILEKKPEITHVIESDCDGSHRVNDIVRLSKLPEDLDFCVGSRYLSGSTITGWSLGRRIMSKLLNKSIPHLFNLQMSDITNGLRRYSRNSIELLAGHKPINKGFIYLSEQAIILNKFKISANEIPIVFEQRIAGESSVTFKDLSASFLGLLEIVKLRKKFLDRK